MHLHRTFRVHLTRNFQRFQIDQLDLAVNLVSLRVLNPIGRTLPARQGTSPVGLDPAALAADFVIQEHNCG